MFFQIRVSKFWVELGSKECIMVIYLVLKQAYINHPVVCIFHFIVFFLKHLLPEWKKFLLSFTIVYYLGFPGGSVGKEFACNAGRPRLSSWGGRSPGKENSNLFQYSCLENPMDRGACRAI